VPPDRDTAATAPRNIESQGGQRRTAQKGGRGGTSQVTVAANDRSVNLPVLPWCWSELGIGKDTRVTITAQGGYRPADPEDRRALAELITRFRALTAPDAGQTPKTRSTTALARRVVRR
jgi:hypothetical protein